MSNRVIKLERNDVLFREGDSSESMYLIKSGRLAIFRENASKDKEIVLSEKVHGELLGEMAFFDNHPRSAGAKAVVPSELIELPFKALQEQLQSSPAWLKVLIKTVINQLRKANVRIRNLENITEDSYDKISPHTLLSICSVLHLLASKSPKNEKGLPLVPYKELHFYSKQTFQQRSPKIKRVVALLKELNLIEVQGDANDKNESQMVVLQAPKLLFQFVEWFSGHLSASDAERVVIDVLEYNVLQILTQTAKDLSADKDGIVAVNIEDAKKIGQEKLNLPLSVKELDSLAKKKMVRERALENQVTLIRFVKADIEMFARFWGIIHGANKPFV